MSTNGRNTLRANGSVRRSRRVGRWLAAPVAVALALIGTAGAAQAAPGTVTTTSTKVATTSARVATTSAKVATTSARSAASTQVRPASTHALVSATPAAAAGALSPSGCTVAGTDVACDLWSLPGTTSILGRSIPIWGFSSTGAAGSATAPGPRLVVRVGDTVTVTLHNGIDTAMSLAFPGIPSSSFSSGLSASAQENGVATGGTTSYTFRATRPGTFLYEAGHTANGSRQVAMGLAGALVVLPGDGTAYGTPATAYDDEAVLVLSEIDPALNANPLTFDLRSFAPQYRLINGKAFPETDAVATDQGHKVLLRLVNAGARTHAMGLLGGDQVVVGSEGHPAPYPQRLTVAAVPPGETLDTITTMPTGPEAKVTLAETGEVLANANQTTADPTQTATGGMLTFLDTAAPPPATDVVGPVATKVTAGPNPSNGLTPVTVTADLSDVAQGNSPVTQAEYVIDDAATTGPGFGTPMSATWGTPTVTGATASISTATLAGLDAGRHQVFVRAQDAAGNWGAVGSVVLNLPKTGPSTTNGSAKPTPAGAALVKIAATADDTLAGGTINGAEYFLDTAGAAGTGTTMTRNRTATVVSLTATIAATAVQALSEGTHHVLVRSHDSLGLWGPVLDIPLVVDHTGPTVDGAAVGPNPTNGVLSDQANPGYLVVSATVTDRDAGSGLQSTVVGAEAFVDPTTTTPAAGSGLQMVASDGSFDSASETAYGLIPLSQLTGLANGAHIVSVRGKDAAGNWGTLFPATLVVDRTAPQLTGLTASPNPTNSAPAVVLTASTNETLFRMAEFWRGTDPGVGAGTSVPVSYVNGKVVVSVPLAGVPVGSQSFGLRVQDNAGNWSNALTTTVSVTRATAVFSDTFDSGTLGAWSGSTGNVAVTSAAGLPAGATNRGLAVTLSGGTANRPSYVVDNTPAAETAYDAQVDLNANTLTTGTGATSIVTLFESRTDANAQVYALQYRGAGTTAQVRVVLDRTGGLAPVNGAWVTLGTGRHTLKTAWRAGPATGTGFGEVVLRRDGAIASTVTGRTTGLVVDTAWLGVTGGVNATATSPMAGTAWFDSFVSTRVGP